MKHRNSSAAQQKLKRQSDIADTFLEPYRKLVRERHPQWAPRWPVLSGYNVQWGFLKEFAVVCFRDTGNPVTRSYEPLGNIEVPGLDSLRVLDASNRALVRSALRRYFNASDRDAVVVLAEPLADELQAVLEQHEFAMGLVPMKVFLSHKGSDKPKVRDFKATLALLGFDPWLDEDAMHAGVELERGILRGFKESCAAVFFITAAFKDENYLASEVNYAIAEKRERGDRFAIVTIVLDAGGVVPDLLRPYVWKEPKTDLEALREVIKALPVQVGRVYWKAI